MSKPTPAKRGEIDIKTHSVPEIETRFFEIGGHIDLFSYQKVKEALNEWRDKGEEKNILFDLRGAEYVASAGWAVMFNAAFDSEQQGGKAVVYNMPERVHHSLQHITANRGVLIIASDEAEARKIVREANAA